MESVASIYSIMAPTLKLQKLIALRNLTTISTKRLYYYYYFYFPNVHHQQRSQWARISLIVYFSCLFSFFINTFFFLSKLPKIKKCFLFVFIYKIYLHCQNSVTKQYKPIKEFNQFTNYLHMNNSVGRKEKCFMRTIKILQILVNTKM